MDYKEKILKHGVTDKNYYLNPRLKQKLDLMIDRSTGKNEDDNVIILDGDEGQGKSTLAVQICYYYSYVAKKPYPFNCSNLFFDLEKLISYAGKTDNQVLHWDEAAMGGMGEDWFDKNQKKFRRLLMVARKKRHFIVMCIPKFFSLNKYFIIDRSIALLNVYSRKNIKKGSFRYFKKSQKEALYLTWKRTQYRKYNKFKSFSGTFPNNLPLLINKEIYDEKKDQAILDICGDKNATTAEEKKADENKIKLLQLRHKISNLNLKGITKHSLAQQLGVNNGRFYDWRKYPEIFTQINFGDFEKLGRSPILLFKSVPGDGQDDDK